MLRRKTSLVLMVSMVAALCAHGDSFDGREPIRVCESKW